ncbi:MAG: T9SS type A sorting domain-containing protein [Bacteroidetes bacterium]|nr:T9SS type A sorting domain-containing protein [Bacteroidota bacterium]
MNIKPIALTVLISLNAGIICAQCDSVQMTLDISQPTCYNYSDGNIDVTVTGATAPVNVTITNENGIIVDHGKKTFLLMGGGWYYIYLVDGNGCELYDSVYLVNPPQMIALMTVTDPGYVGACDGWAVVDTVLNYQGSFANIGYYWSPDGPYGLGQNIKYDLCDANYNLVINDEIGCSIIEYLTVGSVSMREEQADMQLFPNPATGYLNLKSPQLLESVIITDLSGKTWLTLQGLQAYELELNVAFLPAGFYLVNYRSGMWVGHSSFIRNEP